MGKLLFGVGVNDSGYNIESKINGKRVVCPFYRKWRDMLMRCYSYKYQSKLPTYIGCTVCDEWLVFSVFRTWMEGQDWHGKQLDKDLLNYGNKVYSPSSCVFVSNIVNNFMNVRDYATSDGLHGAINKQFGKYTASCRNPIKNKKEYLGFFETKEQSNEAWRKRKHEIAICLAKLETNDLVKEVLLTRYKH